jgi:hypothetical protein
MNGYNDNLHQQQIDKLTHSMTEELFATILAANPSSILILDRAFGGDVNLRLNLLLQAEQQGVEVEVV